MNSETRSALYRFLRLKVKTILFDGRPQIRTLDQLKTAGGSRKTFQIIGVTALIHLALMAAMNLHGRLNGPALRAHQQQHQQQVPLFFLLPSLSYFHSLFTEFYWFLWFLRFLTGSVYLLLVFLWPSI